MEENMIFAMKQITSLFFCLSKKFAKLDLNLTRLTNIWSFKQDLLFQENIRNIMDYLKNKK